MKTIKLTSLALITQSLFGTVVNADSSVCVHAGGSGQEYIRNYNNCVDMFNNAGSSSGPSALGMIFIFIFAVIIITFLYIFISSFIETHKHNKPLKKISSDEVNTIWAHYGLFEVFNKEEGKDALIAISSHLGISQPREKTSKEKEEFKSMSEDWKIILENRRYTDGIHTILAKRISKGDYGKFKKFIYHYFPIGFSCNAFIKQMIDWKKAYEKLVKEGREDDFLSVLNSIEIDLDAVDITMLHKPALNKLKKDELLAYAEERRVYIDKKDTKRIIINKLIELTK